MAELLYAYLLLSAVALLAFRNMYNVLQPALMALYFMATALLQV